MSEQTVQTQIVTFKKIQKIWNRPVMLCLALTILFIIGQTTATRYTHLSYSEIIAQWRLRTQTDPNLREHSVDSLHALPNYINCGDRPCEFPIFEYTAPDFVPSETSPTVFVVAGFHGDEVIGVSILHYAYEYIKTGHVIFLPVANPSGMYRNMRQEYPTMIDPNRDFPFATNSDKCYVSATSRVIDYIYRTWRIDMAVSLHGGGNQIGWNWGTSLKIGTKAPDDLISSDIAASMHAAAGEGNQKFGMPELLLGDMNSVVYPAPGTFEDWAYAASWSPEYLSNCHNHTNYPPYPQNMTTSLVFLFEAGTKRAPQELLGSAQCVGIPLALQYSDSHCNGYVSRGIRVLRALFLAVYPKLVMTKSESKGQLVFRVKGCKTVQLNLNINGKAYETQLTGSLSSHHYRYSLTFEQLGLGSSGDTSNRNLDIHYSFACDPSWKNLGRSVFSKGREYKGVFKTHLDELSLDDDSYDYYELSEQMMVLYGIVIVILVMMLVLLVKMITKVCQTKKFQTIPLASTASTLVENESKDILAPSFQELS